jgi:hypothetical protein
MKVTGTLDTCGVDDSPSFDIASTYGSEIEKFEGCKQCMAWASLHYINFALRSN